jgi:hypothetical protein
VLASTALAVPAAHDEHTERPLLSANVPFAHGVHALAEDAPLKYPRSHCEHSNAPALLYKPGAHATHAASETLRVFAFAVPAGHARHSGKPVEDANRPTGHDTHPLAAAPL